MITMINVIGIYLRDKYFEKYPALIDVEAPVPDKKS